MKRLLRSVRTRIERADKHLADLKVLLERWRQQDPNASVEDDFKLSMRTEVIGFELTEPMLGILIGEVVYNLRATLDYLVYALARQDSGGFQSGTQFPIEDTPDGFRRRLKIGWLNGLNAAHVAAIEGLQPYNGCDWTKALRDLSNPDKHRHLSRLRGTLTTFYREAPGPEQTAIGAAPVTYVDMESRGTLDVAFADGTPIIDTLEKLKLKVAETLQAFESEFKTP